MERTASGTTVLSYAARGGYRNRLFKIGYSLRACSVSRRVRIFEHNFAEDKAKILAILYVLQGFGAKSSAKFAKKTCAKRY